MEVEEAKSEESTTAVQHLPEIGGVGIRRDYLRHSAWTKAVLRYCSLGFQDAGAGEDPGYFNYRDLPIREMNDGDRKLTAGRFTVCQEQWSVH
jgi:hypothetical protein